MDIENWPRKPRKKANDPPATLVSAVVTDRTRSAILAGKLRPGERLRQEELAEQYDTSRIPIREALQQLESEGLVVLVPNSGAWIPKLDRKECVEIYKIREKLEPLAILESTPLLSDETIEQLERISRELESVADVEEFLRLDREMHLLSYTAAPMPTLVATINRFWNSTQHYRRAFVSILESSVMSVVHDEHRLLIDAVKSRDGERAASLLHGHIRRTRRRLEDTTGIFE